MSNETIMLSRKQNVIQFIKFTLFSISAGGVQIVSFTLLNELTGMTYWPCYLIALVLSVLYNFTINRQFTFKSAANISIAMLKVLGYYCVFTPLSTLWGDALTRAGWNEYLVVGGTMAVNFVTEFLFVRFVVFKDSINTNRLGKIENERQKAAALKNTPQNTALAGDSVTTPPSETPKNSQIIF